MHPEHVEPFDLTFILCPICQKKMPQKWARIIMLQGSRIQWRCIACAEKE